MTQNDKKLSVALYISGSVHHMIETFGTHKSSDDISRIFFHFFKILIFWVVKGVKREKKAKKYKNSACLTSYRKNYILCTPPLCYGGLNLQPNFQKWGGLGRTSTFRWELLGKRAWLFSGGLQFSQKNKIWNI